MPSRVPCSQRTSTVLVLVLMLPHLTGFGGYHTEVTPDPELQPAKPRTVYRLWNAAGQDVVGRSVSIVGDSIRGIKLEPRRDSIVMLHRKDIRVVERAGIDGVGTALGVLAIGALAVVALLASSDFTVLQ